MSKQKKAPEAWGKFRRSVLITATLLAVFYDTDAFAEVSQLEIAKSLVLFRGIERVSVIFGAFALIFLGGILFRWGFTKDTSMSAEGATMKLKLTNASPGVLIALFGAFVLIHTTSKQLGFDLNEIAGGQGSSSTLRVTYSKEAHNSVSEFLNRLSQLSLDGSAADMRRTLGTIKSQAAELQTTIDERE
jgi:hypothetical protein